MDELSRLRAEIDQTDSELCALFKKRMEAARSVAKYKKENSIPVLSLKREEKIIERVTFLVGEELSEYAADLYREIFRLSREYQQKLIEGDKL